MVSVHAGVSGQVCVDFVWGVGRAGVRRTAQTMPIGNQNRGSYQEGSDKIAFQSLELYLFWDSLLWAEGRIITISVSAGGILSREPTPSVSLCLA